MFFPWDYPGRVLVGATNASFNFPPYMYAVSVVLFIMFTLIGAHEFKSRDI
jgi:hypothetical protein